MIKYGVRLLKNVFYALSVPEGVELQHDQLVLIRTEKGDEVAKVIRLNSCVVSTPVLQRSGMGKNMKLFRL